jgi:hypothetical protein
LAAPETTIHSGLQPYLPLTNKKYNYQPDSLLSLKTGKWFKDKLFHRDFVDLNVKAEKFQLRINPILNLETGKDFADTAHLNLYTNTRGIIGAGQIGDRFYFETLFAENQSVFPLYLDKHVRTEQIVPGQGRWKTFKNRGYDYAFESTSWTWKTENRIRLSLFVAK